MNRDQEIVQRSHSFREQYRKETPSWYRGEMHLAFTLLFTGGVVWYCAANISQASWAEWLWVVLPMFLFGNWAEWAGHRYLLHSPRSILKPAYKRHVNTHHQFFSHKTLDYHGQQDWRALLFPPFAPVLFVVAALPPAALLRPRRQQRRARRCRSLPRGRHRSCPSPSPRSAAALQAC